MKIEKAAYQSLIYAFAIVLQHASSLVMLPIYTRYLTPADYGVADLLAMGVEIVGLVLGVVSTEAIFRFYYEKKDPSYQRRVVFTVFLISLIVNAIGYLFIIISNQWSAEYFFTGVDVDDARFLVLLFGATIVFQVMSAVPMAYIRAQQKPVLYVLLAALRLALALGFNLYFVVYQELHITGVIYATFSFTAVHGLILSAYLLLKTRIAFSADVARQSLSFSWPLMLSSIALFVTTYGDRLFIKHYAGIAEVGIYSLAYKFGFILVAIGWASFAQAWDVRRYEVVQQDDAIPIFQKMFRLTQMLVFLAALGLSLFSQELLIVMAADEFHRAYRIVGLIVLAYVFNIWTHYCIFGILHSKRTEYKAIIDTVILVFALCLYGALVPDNGAMGAAWATLISLAARFLLINYYATRLYDQELEWGRVVLALGVAISFYLICFWVQLPLVQSFFMKLGFFVLFIVYICLFGLKSEERAAAFELSARFVDKLGIRKA